MYLSILIDHRSAELAVVSLGSRRCSPTLPTDLTRSAGKPYIHDVRVVTQLLKPCKLPLPLPLRD